MVAVKANRQVKRGLLNYDFHLHAKVIAHGEIEATIVAYGDASESWTYDYEGHA